MEQLQQILFDHKVGLINTEEAEQQVLNLFAVSSNAVCKHTWDKETGKWEQGRPHIGIKGRWIRTCTTCGAKESFSKGMFNGWYSAK